MLLGERDAKEDVSHETFRKCIAVQCTNHCNHCSRLFGLIEIIVVTFYHYPIDEAWKASSIE